MDVRLTNDDIQTLKKEFDALMSMGGNKKLPPGYPNRMFDYFVMQFNSDVPHSMSKEERQYQLSKDVIFMYVLQNVQSRLNKLNTGKMRDFSEAYVNPLSFQSVINIAGFHFFAKDVFQTK